MKYKLAFFATVVFLITRPAIATDNDYDHMQITLHNKTNHICTLTNSSIIHGSKVSEPPSILFSEDKLTFEMEQDFFSLYGSAIELSYVCGKESYIVFTVEQPYIATSLIRMAGIKGEKTPSFDVKQAAKLILTTEANPLKPSVALETPSKIELAMQNSD